MGTLSASNHMESSVILRKSNKIYRLGFVGIYMDSGPTDLFIGFILYVLFCSVFFCAYRPLVVNKREDTWLRVQFAQGLLRLPLSMTREPQVFSAIAYQLKRKKTAGGKFKHNWTLPTHISSSSKGSRFAYCELCAKHLTVFHGGMNESRKEKGIGRRKD